MLDSPMKLRGAQIARSAERAEPGELGIAGGRVCLEGGGGSAVDLTGYLLLPGLINAHDHLEFSLFPRLSGRRYLNMREWAADVYRPDESPVREHRRVPRDVRLAW